MGNLTKVKTSDQLDDADDAHTLDHETVLSRDWRLAGLACTFHPPFHHDLVP